jgi:hypothetical protein
LGTDEGSLDRSAKRGTFPMKRGESFCSQPKGVEFLFNKELADYCDGLAKEAINVRGGEQMLAVLPVGEHRTKTAEAWAERMMWFTNQLDEIKKQFGPFLKIRA